MTSTMQAKAVLASAAAAALLYFSGLLVVLTPLPLLYVLLTQGRRQGLYAFGLAGLAVVVLYALVLPAWAPGVASGGSYIPMPWIALASFLPVGAVQIMGVGYFVFFFAIAWALSEGSRRKLDVMRWCGLSVFTALGVVAAIALIISIFGMGQEVVNGFGEYTSFIMGEMAKVGAAAGGNKQFVFLFERREEFSRFFVNVTPSIIFVFTLIAVVLNLLVGRRFMKRRRAFHHIHNVARFRLPDYLIWGVIVGGLAFFADRYLFRAGFFDAVSTNILIVLGSLYFFQGLAVIVYYLQGLRLPLMRTIAYLVIIFFFQSLSVFIVALGIADVWVNFRMRKWRTRHENS
jgi:Predicted membrane protein (DUF2232)